MNAITLIRERRTVRLGAVMITPILLLVLSVSCTSATSQSSGQITPTTIEQQVAPATPLPAAKDEELIPTDTAEVPAPTDTVEASVPAGWLTHNNERCEYAISYPSEMKVTDQDMGSQLLAFDLDDPEVGHLNFIYISVIGQNSPTTGEEIIYNYDATESEILLNMQVGESKPSRDIADIAEWFTYERKPDTIIGGYGAQTYENTQPWEFPGGTKEVRYYLMLNDCTYMIGGYLDTTNSIEAGAINEELFSQIVATIQLP